MHRDVRERLDWMTWSRLAGHPWTYTRDYAYKGWTLVFVTSGIPAHCYACKRETGWVSLAFEVGVCGPHCMDQLDVEFFLANLSWHEGAD